VVSLAISITALRRNSWQSRFAMKTAELQVRRMRPAFWSAVRQAWAQQPVTLEATLDRAGPATSVPNRAPIQRTAPEWIAGGTVEQQQLWRFVQTFYPPAKSLSATCDLTIKQQDDFKAAQGELSNYYNVFATQIAPSRFSLLGIRYLAREELAQRHEVWLLTWFEFALVIRTGNLGRVDKNGLLLLARLLKKG
jgi:hypothetical protein